jgi:hypothetical protein
MVALEPHLLFLVLQLLTPVVVEVLVIPQILLEEQAVQAEVVLEQQAQQTQLLELLIPEAAVVGQEIIQTQPELLQAQAAQASSSLNTPHHCNPYSHSKVLPVG